MVRKATVFLWLILLMLTGCVQLPERPQVLPVPIEKTVIVTQEAATIERIVTATPEIQAQQTAHYIFLFIGDGMGLAQRSTAELYLAATNSALIFPPQDELLVINTFPIQGINTTYDLSRAIPDSASTGTAIACGQRTTSGALGMNPESGEVYSNIAEIAKAHDWKIGIITSAALNHATPAAFYAHVPSRTDYYEIADALSASNFDYFAGGALLDPTGSDELQPNAYELAQQRGYRVLTNNDEFRALPTDAEKSLIINQAAFESLTDNNALRYEIDRPSDDVSLAEYVQTGITMLDNTNGFFMVVEGGKIDWSCHANDAATTVREVLAFEDAVKEAFTFYQEHPEETLIIITADHETGGLSLGYAATGAYSSIVKLQYQTMSYESFGKELDRLRMDKGDNMVIEDVYTLLYEAFGLEYFPDETRLALEERANAGDEAAAKQLQMVLTPQELTMLQEAFDLSTAQAAGNAAPEGSDYYVQYASYDPLVITAVKILNHKAGIGWTTFSHSGNPVVTSAIGVGSELINGYHHQINIFEAMRQAAGF